MKTKQLHIHYTSRRMFSLTCVLTYLLISLLAACSEDESAGKGSLTVLLEAEDVITEGLEPGDGSENIGDGWGVSFDKYIITVGQLDLHLSTDESVELETNEAYVIDMTQIPAGGLELWKFDQIREGRWEFNYATPGAGDGATRYENVSEEDYNEMVTNDWTYLIDGVLSKSDGQSCPPIDLAMIGEQIPNGQTSGNHVCYDAPTVRLSLGATAETVFGPCEIGGVPGFSVSSGGTQTVAATIHGDHLFFNGFPEGDEGGIKRLAQWVADCDLNLDGVVTQAELELISPSQLPEIDERYQLGGSPITPLENMYQYVIAQLKTQGHYQGEGECPYDGIAHVHGDDHDDHDDHEDHEGE